MTSFYGMVSLGDGGGSGGGITREQVQQMINHSVDDMKEELENEISGNIEDNIKRDLLNYHLDDDPTTPEDDDGVLVFPMYPSGS